MKTTTLGRMTLLTFVLVAVIGNLGCPKKVATPNVTGMTRAAAEAAITSANLTVGTVTEAFSDTVADGNVISQDPTAGTQVARGTSVSFVVSKGPATRTVPGVVGSTQAQAEADIVAAGLTVGTVTEAFSDTVADGNVISQDPVAASSVASGSAVNLVVSKGPEPAIVPELVGRTQAEAETALATAGLTAGNVTEAFSNTIPAGSVVSQDPAANSSVPRNSTVNLVISLGSLVTVSGHIQFDDGAPVVGAQVTGSVAAEELAALLREALQREAALSDWTNRDAKSTGQMFSKFPSLLSRILAPKASDPVATDANGDFLIEIVAPALAARILVEVSYDADPLPVIQNAKWSTAETSVLDVGTIALPNPQGAEVPLASGGGQTTDGDVKVEGLPASVETLYAQSYDPDVSPESFPGDFMEMAAIPLNSSVFLWMEALDAEGNPVHELGQAATIRSRVPPTQWIDLEDINAGTDRIEVPIYTFNETLNVWEQESIGWLEDGARTVLPEDAQSVILDGTFTGDIYATFNTNHFSYMNVDYAYIGAWTLSRIDRAKRNNDCLYNAMQLAKKIARSATGHTAYARVNVAGANLDTELADSMGPELKTSVQPDSYGVYKGDSGGSETQIEIADDIWDGCGEGATADQKKNTTFIMAVTILHETAHWKDDVKKYPADDTDSAGEEGNQLESDLFGGLIGGGADGITRDGAAVTAAQLDAWLNQDSWPPPPPPPPAGGRKDLIANAAGAPKAVSLQVSIVLPKETFELGEEIPVEITYTNISASPIQVMNRMALEGWPLHFNIIKQGTETRVRFLGPELKQNLTDEDFSTLNPSETLVQTVNLLRDPEDDAPRYQLIGSGVYDLTTVYESFRGVDEAVSNMLTFTVLSGGSISGTVKSAENGLVLGGATIRVFQGDFLLTTATADPNGEYSFAELPAGTYTLEAQASGFLRSRQEGVQVVSGQNTPVNFNLSPLLAQGELRLVLTWGEAPRDLDSHFWLPAETPYHLFYSRRGNLENCPFALLDVDDTSGFGPETITISQRMLQGTYLYAIYNYTGSPSLVESQAQVQVFDATGLIATFDVPAEGEGPFWNVLSIDGPTGAITEINTLSGNPEPYPNTDSGCTTPPAR